MAKRKSKLWLKKPKQKMKCFQESIPNFKQKAAQINWTELFVSELVTVKLPVSVGQATNNTSKISTSPSLRARLTPVKKLRFSVKRGASPFKSVTPSSTHMKSVLSNIAKTPSKSPSRKRIKTVSARSLFSNPSSYLSQDDTFEKENEERNDEFFIAHPLNRAADIKNKTENVTNDNTQAVNDEYEKCLIDMERLMPSVVRKLSEESLSDTLCDFFKLIDNNEFPLRNIFQGHIKFIHYINIERFG